MNNKLLDKVFTYNGKEKSIDYVITMINGIICICPLDYGFCIPVTKSWMLQTKTDADFLISKYTKL